MSIDFTLIVKGGFGQCVLYAKVKLVLMYKLNRKQNIIAQIPKVIA